jgi:thioredoxin domain-containing protein 5
MLAPILSILSILIILLVLLRIYNNRQYEGFENGSRTVVICKADWCGHCKKAAPEFSKLLAASPITLKDGSKVVVKILDADKDKAEIGQYKVKGFPTILVVDGGQTTEYPGERTASGVIDFLNSNY